MHRSTFLAVSFVIGLIFSVVGALLKIMHWGAADIMLPIGMVSSFIFIIVALYEIWTSKKILAVEKLMWTVGFTCLSGIIGIIYLVSGRKTIVDKTTVAGYDAV